MTTISIASEAELTEAVRAARDTGRTLEILGAGTKKDYGHPVAADDVLDLSGLSGIVSYEPEELVLSVRAGTPVAEVEALLEEHHQRLGFDPADWGPLFGTEARQGTIGGALSADTSGSARVRYGAARDHLIGFRAVNGHGEAYKGGGKVVKNVTGFDLPKLMCGALGTLGPLSEVTLRLVPRAPQSETIIVRDLEPEAGLRLLRRIWAMPLEATGLAYIPACIADSFGMLGGIGAGAAAIRVDGRAAALTEKCRALHVAIDGHEGPGLEEGDALFAAVASGNAFVGSDVDVWRIAVPPSESASLAHALVGTRWCADWAGGLFWVGMSGTDETSARRLRHIAARASGHATLLRAPQAFRATTSVFPQHSDVLASLTRAVTAAFDPPGMFNPGRRGL